MATRVFSHDISSLFLGFTTSKRAFVSPIESPRRRRGFGPSKLTLSRIALLILPVFALFIATGCQDTHATAVTTDLLPAPNFNGPQILKPAVVVAPPPMIALMPVRPMPSAPSAAVPAGWLPAASPRPWRYIVIHHSATTTGGAKAFDAMHKSKGWDELGYHFVIGNGTQTGNGQVEIGPRWPKQKWGAHAKTADNKYNDFGIGICLVGNFDLDRPTAEQQRSLVKLVAYLMKTYKIRPENVIGHGETKSTDCPGRYMNVANIRRQATQMLADAGDVIPQPTLSARLNDGELLMDKRPQQ